MLRRTITLVDSVQAMQGLLKPRQRRLGNRINWSHNASRWDARWRNLVHRRVGSPSRSGVEECHTLGAGAASGNRIRSAYKTHRSRPKYIILISFSLRHSIQLALQHHMSLSPCPPRDAYIVACSVPAVMLGLSADSTKAPKKAPVNHACVFYGSAHMFRTTRAI